MGRTAFVLRAIIFILSHPTCRAPTETTILGVKNASSTVMVDFYTAFIRTKEYISQLNQCSSGIMEFIILTPSSIVMKQVTSKDTVTVSIK